MITSTCTSAPPIGRRRIPRDALTDAQAAFVTFALDRLGTAHGLAEDTPAIPYTDRADRLSISELAAWSLGLTLTPGCELAQCYVCDDLLDGALTDEDSTGIIRCTDCHEDHTADDADDFDMWADFYRT